MKVTYNYWHNVEETYVHYSGTMDELPTLREQAQALATARNGDVIEGTRRETNNACVSVRVQSIIDPPVGAELSPV